MNSTPQHQIRAVYDEYKIRVYQAYSDQLAKAALSEGTFASPLFSMTRMTWIKPSFLWMMYRSEWGRKDLRQSRILAIDITRIGFEWALEHSCPSRPSLSMSPSDRNKLKTSFPVRIQWDPERDIYLQPLRYRSIQIGLGGEAAPLYINQWIQKITDITDLAQTIHGLVEKKKLDSARAMLPLERPYFSDKI